MAANAAYRHIKCILPETREREREREREGLVIEKLVIETEKRMSDIARGFEQERLDRGKRLVKHRILRYCFPIVSLFPKKSCNFFREEEEAGSRFAKLASSARHARIAARL